MELHYTPNTISIAVAIALEEQGAPYDKVAVDFASAEQTKPAYLAVNPKGRVPALVTDHGILTETGAILEYAAPSLVPSDPFKAAKMREVMFYLASTMHVNHAHKLRGARWANDESSFADMKAKVPETMTASCAYLEENFAFDPFVTGDAITLADPYLTLVLSWAEGDGVDLSAFPKISAYIAMMNDRASVKKVREMGMLT